MPEATFFFKGQVYFLYDIEINIGMDVSYRPYILGVCARTAKTMHVSDLQFLEKGGLTKEGIENMTLVISLSRYFCSTMEPRLSEVNRARVVRIIDLFV